MPEFSAVGVFFAKIDWSAAVASRTAFASSVVAVAPETLDSAAFASATSFAVTNEGATSVPLSLSVIALRETRKRVKSVLSM